MTGAAILGARWLLMAMLAAAPAGVLAQDAPPPAAAPAAPAAPAKITDKAHPDYVRCRSEEIIGSRAQFRRTCKTNREWADVAAKGGRSEREILNRASSIGGITPQ
jgi:hypothetical protein